MPEILERVQAFDPEEGIIIIAPFLPSPLIELLGSRGFSSKIEPGGAGRWMVYFWPGGD